MIRIVNAADTDLVQLPLFEKRFSTATEPGVMDRTNLGATKPHMASSLGRVEYRRLLNNLSPW
jgi:hypothetical protein